MVESESTGFKRGPLGDFVDDAELAEELPKRSKSEEEYMDMREDELMVPAPEEIQLSFAELAKKLWGGREIVFNPQEKANAILATGPIFFQQAVDAFIRELNVPGNDQDQVFFATHRLVYEHLTDLIMLIKNKGNNISPSNVSALSFRKSEVGTLIDWISDIGYTYFYTKKQKQVRLFKCDEIENCGEP